MSKYSKYIIRLDEAFKDARSKYEEALSELDAAEAAVNKANYIHETYIGERADRNAVAQAILAKAKLNMNRVKATAWPEFERVAAQLTRDLDEEIKKESLASPDAIDANGLELLKSGVMSADDFEGMIQRYNGNPTMLRMIAKFAGEKAEAMGGAPNMAEERSRLTYIAMTVDGKSVRRQDWDNLLTIARTCAGIRHNGTDYLPYMGARWEEFTAPFADF